MNEPVTVSVVIPLYNAAGVVRDTIRTALDQTWKDREIVVIDDGSTDGSGALAQAYRGQIRYYRFENGGVAKARNRGIALSRGRYIAFLDHDDLWEPDKLAKQAAVLGARPEVGLVITGVAHLEYDGTPRADFPRGPAGRFYQLFVKGYGPTPSSSMVRRSVIERVGGLDERFNAAGMDDHEFWPRVADACEVALVDEPLTLHRAKLKEPKEVGVWHRALLNDLLLARYGSDPERRRFLMEERAANLADLGKWHAQHGERAKALACLKESLGMSLTEAWNWRVAWRAASRLARVCW